MKITEQIKHMVSRFLQWKLPSDFNPDGGISFKKDFNEDTAHPMKHEPVGTNLLTATQAEEMVSFMLEGMDMGKVSDGYHTFDELYDHRITLFIALCNQLEGNNHPAVWKSKKHSDGSVMEGWFIMGINFLPGEQITYHLPLSRWEETGTIKEMELAPEWDGHTSADVLTRLKNL